MDLKNDSSTLEFLRQKLYILSYFWQSLTLGAPRPDMDLVQWIHFGLLFYGVVGL